MATIGIPDEKRQITGFESVRVFLQRLGVWHDRWQAAETFPPDADQNTILKAYQHVLEPYMQSNGYKVADVINVTPQTPNLSELRAKFLREHTHTEDEVRFFVDGQGFFWFNLGNGAPVFYVHCTAGDLLSVPAHTKHWFDLGEPPFVKAIRIFIDPTGWVPHYTDSGIETRYHY